MSLRTFGLERGTGLAQARPWNQARVTLESPALEVMTDLTLVKAATTHPSTSLRQAEQLMIYQGVRMLFVVVEMPHIEGLITTTDLHDDKRMRVVHERGVHHDELTVADVMTELARLDAVDFARVGNASVGQLVATLKRLGRQHMLVVEAASGDAPRRIRGVISRSQIERQLGSPVDVSPLATSFAEIERALV